MRQLTPDKVGLGWRSELAPSILLNLDQIDVVEVIVDDYLKAPTSSLRALRTLSSQVEVIYHGVGLGLASAEAVQQKRLEKTAKVMDYLKPKIWSEHLAFVRSGGIEIGHLAAPPRTEQTIHGALSNLDQIKRTIGISPSLENIATLLNPPGSKMSEPQWVSSVIQESNCDLLLDLHNLYSNAVNFGFDPAKYLEEFPLDRVNLVHLSGGKWIKEPENYKSNPSGLRLLDDHIHDVPDIVFDLLGLLASKVAQPLTVIIERDGEYPEFQSLLLEIQRTKKVLRDARSQQVLFNRKYA